jgi:hypothetical protein
MVEFTAGERAFLEEMRGLAKDGNGLEVLVGLTLEETEFYVDYTRRRAAGAREHDPANRERFFALHEKHDLVRRQVILAESEARRDGAPRH